MTQEFRTLNLFTKQVNTKRKSESSSNANNMESASWTKTNHDMS